MDTNETIAREAAHAALTLDDRKDVYTMKGLQRLAVTAGTQGDAWAAAELDVENFGAAVVAIMIAAYLKGVDLESLVIEELKQRGIAV